MAMVQVHTGHDDLLSMETGFPMGDGLDNHEDLIDDFGVSRLRLWTFRGLGGSEPCVQQ